MDMIAPIRVLFLSQQRLLRELFSAAFSTMSDIEFLPSVSEGNEAIASMLQFEPHVVVIDLNPSLFGVRITKQLQAACPGCKILILASHCDAIMEGQLTGVGVQGVVSKNISIDDLAWAIRQVFYGQGVCMSDGKPVAADSADIRTTNGMTEREAQVLELVAQGLANKQIATALGISTKTVEKHRHRVMCKLQAHETAGLTWRAICMGVGRATPALACIPV